MLYAIFIHSFAIARSVSICVSVKGGAHIDTTDCSTPWIPCLIGSFSGDKQSRGVTYADALPLTVLCPLCVCIQIKTMASTSSASQVSAWTWSWDNLPRSSFLVHQMRASACLSLVSFTFSHLLRTFIIQIRVLSLKTGERMDGSCCRSCAPCASPRATKRQWVVFEGLYMYHKPPEDGGSHCSSPHPLYPLSCR